MISKAVFNRLTNDETLYALVGTRVYPHDVPPTVEPEYPLIVYKPETPHPVLTHDEVDEYGLSDRDYNQIVEIAALCNTYPESQAVGAAIIAALQKQGGEWGGVFVYAVFIEDGSEDTYQLVNVEPTLWVWQADFSWWARD